MAIDMSSVVQTTIFRFTTLHGYLSYLLQGVLLEVFFLSFSSVVCSLFLS
jgi:hypothetical protein